jgi:hypothetical protein
MYIIKNIMESNHKEKIKHIHFDEMNSTQFIISPMIQHLISEIQNTLIIPQYHAFGKTKDSWKNFNIVFPASFGSDRRKPITHEFQQFGEIVYWPIIYTLLFGKDGWEQIKSYLLSFKINTLKVSEDTDYYNTSAYHMHLDNKPGKKNDSDNSQKHIIRIIFSIVPASFYKNDAGILEISNDIIHQSTLYLQQQPIEGFHSQNQYHEYMRQRFPTLSNTYRPIYQIQDNEVCRAKPGQVNIHYSHPALPIHAEANPCPDRTLFAIDFQDIINVIKTDTPKGPKIIKFLPTKRIPTEHIISLMKVLKNPESEQCKNRLHEVIEIAELMNSIDDNDDILIHADKYDLGRIAIHKIITQIIPSFI